MSTHVCKALTRTALKDGDSGASQVGVQPSVVWSVCGETCLLAMGHWRLADVLEWLYYVRMVSMKI